MFVETTAEVGLWFSLEQCLAPTRVGKRKIRSLTMQMMEKTDIKLHLESRFQTDFCFLL